VERDLLSLIEPLHPGALDRADVHENILAAVIRLDETIALLAVEPLHDSLSHMTLPSGGCVKMAARQPQPVRSRFWRRSSVRREVRGEAKSFGRNSIKAIVEHCGLACKAATHEQGRLHAQLARGVRTRS